MKLFPLLAFSLFAFLACAQDFSISKTVHDGEKAPQLSHSGPGRWDNYLAMNLLFNPVEELFKELDTSLPRKLKNRGEAHITVITPIEFWDVLKPAGITVKDLDRIATESKIQSSSFEIRCLAESNAVVEDKKEQTYYIVVKSQDLIDIRVKIQELFKAKAEKNGIDPNSFDPEYFYPHITLGFTNKDLHESNGVIKDGRDCAWSISEF